MSPSFSESKNNQALLSTCFHDGFLFFDPEDQRYVPPKRQLLMDYKALILQELIGTHITRMSSMLNVELCSTETSYNNIRLHCVIHSPVNLKVH
jgi:hypothetical protein